MKQLHVSNIKEIVMEIVFLICACISILSVALICIFLFSNGIPGIAKIGLKEFLLGTEWKPGSNLFGIFSTIVGSIYVTIGAIIVGVPVGLLMAVFMARFCPKKLYRILKPGVELLAGIPSDDNNGTEHPDSLGAAWYDDPANHYQCVRVGDTGGAGFLLSGCSGTGSNS